MLVPNRGTADKLVCMLNIDSSKAKANELAGKWEFDGEDWDLYNVSLDDNGWRVVLTRDLPYAS